MSGGGHAPPPIPSSNGGEFLLSLLQKPQSHQQQQNHNHHHNQRPSLPLDPAVAAVGPTPHFPWSPSPAPTNQQQDLIRTLPWTADAANGGFLGFPHSYFPNQLQGNHQLGFSNFNSNLNSNNSDSSVQDVVRQNHLVEQKLRNPGGGAVEVELICLLRSIEFSNLIGIPSGVTTAISLGKEPNLSFCSTR